MRRRLRCAGCGHDDRPVFKATSDLGESSYSFRLLCRYCLERLKTYREAGGNNQWPYTLVMEIDAPSAWLKNVENQP